MERVCLTYFSKNSGSCILPDCLASRNVVNSYKNSKGLSDRLQEMTPCETKIVRGLTQIGIIITYSTRKKMLAIAVLQNGVQMSSKFQHSIVGRASSRSTSSWVLCVQSIARKLPLVSTARHTHRQRIRIANECEKSVCSYVSQPSKYTAPRWPPSRVCSADRQRASSCKDMQRE